MPVKQTSNFEIIKIIKAKSRPFNLRSPTPSALIQSRRECANSVTVQFYQGAMPNSWRRSARSAQAQGKTCGGSAIRSVKNFHRIYGDSVYWSQGFDKVYIMLNRSEVWKLCAS